MKIIKLESKEISNVAGGFGLDSETGYSALLGAGVVGALILSKHTGPGGRAYAAASAMAASAIYSGSGMLLRALGEETAGAGSEPLAYEFAGVISTVGAVLTFGYAGAIWTQRQKQS